MQTIYKYPLTITDDQTIALPVDHRILTVQVQGSSMYLWALVDTDVPGTVVRDVRIVGTGNSFADAERWLPGYIGTVQQGRYVWHVFVR